MGSFIAPFTSSIISFSVPSMGNSLGAPYTSMIWAPIAFLIPLPSLMILVGKLSDTVGRKLFYMAGLIIFSLGAFAVTLSTDISTVIASILIMGIGASFLAVNSVAIVSAEYPPELRGGALGINAMSVYLGLTSAPAASGFLVEFSGWRSLFYLVSAIAIITLIPVVAYIPAHRRKLTGFSLDMVGFATFLVSILLVVMYLSLSELSGWMAYLYLLITGLLLLLFFVVYESRQINPILNVRLFTRSRTFSAANFTAFLNYISTFAIVFVFSIYFTVIAGLSPSKAGLILTAEPVFMVIFSPISGRLSDTLGSRGLASLGMLLIATAFFALFWLVGTVNPAVLALPLSVVGIGFGLFSAPNTNSVMGSVAREDSGIASGTLGTMRFVGQLMSIAIMGSVLAGSMPRSMLLELFSGISSGVSLVDQAAFVSGMKEVMLISGFLCIVGVFTSLVRNR